MTVQYSSNVFTSTGKFSIFLKLLFRWKGSIYKLIWHDLFIYVIFYYILSVLYRFVLIDEHKIIFESISLHCNSFANLIPVTFVLGFYVSLVIQRWWSQFNYLPWPDSASLWISTCIHGHDERGRLMRRTIVRYLNLTLILTLRLISLPVKKRFPTLDHLVEAGILLEGEKKIFEKMDQLSISHPKYWMPLVWAGSIVTRARKEGRIKDDFSHQSLIKNIDNYRLCNGTLLNFDWVNIPLVYTQVVTLAVYSFFLSTLFGRQFLDVKKKYEGHDVDLYVPVFTFLQFFFYMGWLKVAEALINPFGEDDDDFDVNWMIDRNLQVSYLIVDEMHLEHPELIRDQFWDEAFPELPYTAASEDSKIDPVIGAAAKVEINVNESEFLPIYDDEEDPLIHEDEKSFDEDLGNSRHNIMGSSKPNKNSNSNLKLEGIVIDIPTPKIKNKKRRNLPKNDSAITFRTEHGSMSSFDKPPSTSSRPSLVAHPLNQLIRSGMGGLKSMSVMGSETSLFSRKTKNRLRRRRKMGRSASRISNDSESRYHSPKLSKPEPGFLHEFRCRNEDDDLMSSMTSINTPTETDVNSVYNSRVDFHPRIRELQRQEIRRGIMSHENSGSQIDSAVHLHNKMLRRKLETIQTLHDDILHQLDDEIEEHEKHLNDGNEIHLGVGTSVSELITILEDKTEMLKHQLRRRHKRRIRTDSSSSPVHFNHNELSVEVSDSKPTSVPQTRRTSECIDNIQPNDEEVPTLVAEMPESVPASLHESNLNSTSETLADIVDYPIADESTTKSNNGGLTTEDADSSNTDPSEEEAACNDAYETELSTIEEQPELGYQSDSSESESLIPKLMDDRKKSQSLVKNLPTLEEEDYQQSCG